jgi:hypothetical protein
MEVAFHMYPMARAFNDSDYTPEQLRATVNRLYLDVSMRSFILESCSLLGFFVFSRPELQDILLYDSETYLAALQFADEYTQLTKMLIGAD